VQTLPVRSIPVGVDGTVLETKPRRRGVVLIHGSHDLRAREYTRAHSKLTREMRTGSRLHTRGLLLRRSVLERGRGASPQGHASRG
jgi:hypothetical protein